MYNNPVLTGRVPFPEWHDVGSIGRESVDDIKAMKESTDLHGYAQQFVDTRLLSKTPSKNGRLLEQPHMPPSGP